MADALVKVLQPDRGWRRAVAAFRFRNYAVFWMAMLLSNLGRWTHDVVVPYVLYRLTSSASLVGLSGFLRYVPIVAVGPLAGSLADRLSRRAVMVVTHLVLAAMALGMAAAWAAGFAAPALLLLLSAAMGVTTGLNTPAAHAFVSELVPRTHLLGAITLISAQMNAAKAVGPGLAGVVLATFGAGAAFLMTSAFYGAAVAALAAVAAPRIVRAAKAKRMLGHFFDSARYVLRDPALATCTAAMTAIAVFGMPIFQLMPVFATDVFDVGPTGYGVLAGALGLGAAASAPILSGWTQQLPRGRLIGFSMLGYGGALVAFSQSRGFLLAVFLIALVGVGFLFINSTVGATVQLVVDDAVRASVLAVHMTWFAAALPLGTLAQGWAADHIGAPATVTIAGAVLVTLSGGLLASTRLQRHLNDAQSAESGEAEVGGSKGREPGEAKIGELLSD